MVAAAALAKLSAVIGRRCSPHMPSLTAHGLLLITVVPYAIGYALPIYASVLIPPHTCRGGRGEG